MTTTVDNENKNDATSKTLNDNVNQINNNKLLLDSHLTSSSESRLQLQSQSQSSSQLLSFNDNTYEVSIISSQINQMIMPPTLYYVNSNETFQSLLERSTHFKNDIKKEDILNICCQCSSNQFETVCNVPSSLNIFQTSSRHQFLSIRYDISFKNESTFIQNLNNRNNIHNRINSISYENNDNVKNISNSNNHTESDNIMTSDSQVNQLYSSSHITNFQTTGITRFETVKEKFGNEASFSQFEMIQQHMKTARGEDRRAELNQCYKEFRNRESLLTLLLSIPEFASMYYIFLAGFVIFFTSILIDDFLNKRDIYNSFSIIQWNFSTSSESFQLWSYMFIYAYCIVFLFYFWRHALFIFGILPKKCRDYTFIICYICYLIPLCYYPVTWCKDHPFACSMIISCEQVRLLMKSHAFFIENFKTKRYYDKRQKQRLADNNENNENNNNHNNETHNLNNDHKQTSKSLNKSPKIAWLVNIDLPLADQFVTFTYFLFCPSLVYRTEYPRTKEIHWSKVILLFRDISLSFVAVWILFCRFCIPIFQRTIYEPGNVSTLISSVFNGSLPGMMLLLLGFFGFLHCWLNFFAEILRFGDRQFYQDWWNARSFSQYYRKWNCVVHDWIYNYMYLPVLELNCSKRLAMLIVFASSSIIHEYILTISTKFFYPVLLIMFGGIGVFFIPLTQLWKNARGWNVFLWSNLLIGQGMLLVLYSREWYAQQNDPFIEARINKDSNLPKSWQLFFNSMLYENNSTLF